MGIHSTFQHIICSPACLLHGLCLYVLPQFLTIPRRTNLFSDYSRYIIILTNSQYECEKIKIGNELFYFQLECIKHLVEIQLTSIQ